jgi:hypothetical protein
VPQMGSYMYGTKKVEWSYKNVVLVFTLWLKMKLAGPTEFRCDHLDISTSLDHGKGHSRITVTFIARWQIDNGEWNEDKYSCTIGNARCKKDNAEIIKNTFGPHLNNQNHVDQLRDRLKQSRQKFNGEKKKPENGKAFGQPLRAKSDKILKERGIDQAAQFGSNLEGNGIRKLMTEAISIIDDIEEQVLGMERVAGTNEEIKDMCEKHRQLFTCWDKYFSGLRMKRYHLTDEIANKTKEFLVRSVLLERHLGMSITPKTHVMEDHSITKLVATHGFADLGKDAGERNHQDEAKAYNHSVLSEIMPRRRHSRATTK